MEKFVANSKEELLKEIRSAVEAKGNNVDLNYIDVSKITDMSCLFAKSDFNGDISKWDVSNVTKMNCMFVKSEFNGDISNWNVSNVTEMIGMFIVSKFDGDLIPWASKLTKLSRMDGIFTESKLEENNPFKDVKLINFDYIIPSEK